MMEMRFLCDEMLHGLGRWLRAAGYDSRIAGMGTADADLLRQALSEGRLLLSRDRKLLEYRGAGRAVLWLEANDLEGCAMELCHRVELNWLYRPFSRCLQCNTPLRSTSAAVWPDLPDTVRASGMVLWCCPVCRKVYWEGSHVTRMRTRLQEWQRRCRGEGPVSEPAG